MIDFRHACTTIQREVTFVTLFRLDASINPDGSASRAIGDVVENEWIAAHPGDRVIRRNVGTDPFQSTA